MAYSQRQREYNEKYDREKMVIYSVKISKTIYEQVEKAMKKSGMNRNKWTTTAIKEKLERDENGCTDSGCNDGEGKE